MSCVALIATDRVLSIKLRHNPLSCRDAVAMPQTAQVPQDLGRSVADAKTIRDGDLNAYVKPEFCYSTNSQMDKNCAFCKDAAYMFAFLALMGVAGIFLLHVLGLF
jgi:hypothetical protein